MTRTLVIDGHPDAGSLTAALAQQYVLGAGDTAVALTLRDLDIDPVLRGGYRKDQLVEPDFARARELIEWSEHITVLTPVWWGSVPALLKGFLDRALIIEWAFSYQENGRPEGLLHGRTGRLIVTSDSPRWYLPFVGDSTVKQIKGRTMEFCGIKPVTVTRFADVRNATDAKRAGWLEQSRALGEVDAGARTQTKVAIPA